MDEWEKYELHHRARLAIKPGLTGMWQVSGRSEITDFEEVVKLDTKYISEDWLVARSDGEFVNYVLDLLKLDQGSRGQIGKNAQEFVKKNFTWDKTEQAFRRVLIDEKENIVDFRQ